MDVDPAEDNPLHDPPPPRPPSPVTPLRPAPPPPRSAAPCPLLPPPLPARPRAPLAHRLGRTASGARRVARRGPRHVEGPRNSGQSDASTPTRHEETWRERERERDLRHARCVALAHCKSCLFRRGGEAGDGAGVVGATRPSRRGGGREAANSPPSSSDLPRPPSRRPRPRPRPPHPRQPEAKWHTASRPPSAARQPPAARPPPARTAGRSRAPDAARRGAPAPPRLPPAPPPAGPGRRGRGRPPSPRGGVTAVRARGRRNVT